MIFWFNGLYMDESVRKNEKKCREIIERRSKWQKLPWKKSYYIIMLAGNEKNLFEIMSTDQMFFKYYGYTDIYIVGVSTDYDGAVEMIAQILTDGYKKDEEYDPRKVFTRDRFRTGNA